MLSVTGVMLSQSSSYQIKLLVGISRSHLFDLIKMSGGVNSSNQFSGKVSAMKICENERFCFLSSITSGSVDVCGRAWAGAGVCVRVCVCKICVLMPS